MYFRQKTELFSRARRALILGAVVLSLTTVMAAGGKRVIRKPSYDPAAESVALFDGVDTGLLDATLVAKNPHQGNVLIENKSKKALTVQMPKSVAAVQVLKQGFGGGAGGGIGGQQGGIGGGGGGQSLGGGTGGGQQGLGGAGGVGGAGGGGGFFSIPAETTVQLPFTSVCLEHGKADPRPSMTYKLVRLESYTKDPVLQQLITSYAGGKIDPEVAQAAVWHVANGMSWQELANKSVSSLGGLPSRPYFAPEKLMAAQSFVMQATAQVREREKEKKSPATIEKNL